VLEDPLLNQRMKPLHYGFVEPLPQEILQSGLHRFRKYPVVAKVV